MAEIVTGPYFAEEVRRELMAWYGDKVLYQSGLSVRTSLDGRLQAAGDYAIAVTQPALFAPYLAQQIDLLIDDFGVSVEAAVSATEIPYHYVLDTGEDLDLAGASPFDLSRIFPSTELSRIGTAARELHRRE